VPGKLGGGRKGEANLVRAVMVEGELVTCGGEIESHRLMRLWMRMDGEMAG
jgi:hypothetical protein